MKNVKTKLEVAGLTSLTETEARRANGGFFCFLGPWEIFRALNFGMRMSRTAYQLSGGRQQPQYY